MLENRNYIVPHLAGLPFVEKPPGFQAMIAGPIRAYAFRRPAIRSYLEEVFKIANDREIVLCQPSDMLRGGAGFFRNRTALEMREPEDILGRLLANPPALCLIHIDEDQGIAPELKRRAEIFGVELREDAYVSAGNARSFVLLSVVRRKQIAEMKERRRWSPQRP